MYSGGTKSFLHLLHHVKKKHRVIIVSPNKEGVSDYLSNKGIKIYTFPYIYNIAPFLRSAKDYFLFLPRLIKRKLYNSIASDHLVEVCKKEDVDIIHSNTSVTDIGYRAARRLGIPHIMHIREYGDKDHRMHIFNINEQTKGPYAHTICITKDISDYRGLTGLPTNRIIYNPVIDENEIRYIRDKSPYFLYAGRLDPTKGIEDIIKAYIIYVKNESNTTIDLMIAGSWDNNPELKVKLEQILSEARVTDRVSFLGNVDNIGDIMAYASATIVPSKFEAFGRVFPEAVANGSLVIGRDTGGTHEQFENGLQLTGREIGLRFNSIEDLVQCLHEATRMDNDTRFKFVSSAQEALRNLYTDKQSAGAVLTFYNQILVDDKN